MTYDNIWKNASKNSYINEQFEEIKAKLVSDELEEDDAHRGKWGLQLYIALGFISTDGRNYLMIITPHLQFLT